MRRTFTLFMALLASVFLASTSPVRAQEKATGTDAGKSEATTPHQKPSPDHQAILALFTELESGFNSGDAKAMAACWTESGEFVGPSGGRADGREAIAKVFAEALEAHKGGTMALRILELRVVNENVAIVDVVPEIKPGAGSADAAHAPPTRVAVMVLIKQSGRWLIESARGSAAQAPAEANHLSELEWLVGNWASEASKAGLSLNTSCDWTATRGFLIRKFKLEGKGILLHGGTEIIGWDPHENRIRSWVFDADGGFGENSWNRDGQRWIIKFSGTLADGSNASATHILTKVDADTLSLQSKDRVVAGERQPDVPDTIVKRQAVVKSADTSKAPGGS